jgi:intein/homing endonuclease
MQKDHICFWGNITEDKEYYDITIKDLFQKTFHININPHEKKSNFVYGFYVCKRDIIKFFNENLEFPFGSKTYSVKIPRIIMRAKNSEIWSSFIRGFSDGNGCLNFDKRHGYSYQKILNHIHTYPRIFIKCVSKQLIDELSILLKRLEIDHTTHIGRSKKFNEVNAFVIQIKGKKRLKKWMDVIGFNNPVQQTRYEIFKKHGLVPIRTSLSQRRAILQGKIDPWSFYPSRTRSLAWIGRQDSSVPPEPSKL